jgi:hypothetical protein
MGFTGRSSRISGGEPGVCGVSSNMPGVSMPRVHSSGSLSAARVSAVRPRNSFPRKLSFKTEFLSHSRHHGIGCPLSGVKQTLKFKSVTSAFDPKRTLHETEVMPHFWVRTVIRAVGKLPVTKVCCDNPNSSRWRRSIRWQSLSTRSAVVNRWDEPYRRATNHDSRRASHRHLPAWLP